MSERLAYLDDLKVALVVGVIAVHTAVTYGLDGSWYLESYDKLPDAVAVAAAIVLGTGWLFGLGLFFMIAGRLSAPSLERKGPGRFVRDRLVRLGIPLAGYTLLVSPFLEYVDHRWNGGGEQALWPFVREQVWHLAPGPTWFLEALLVFSLAYALLRGLRRDVAAPRCEPLRAGDVAFIAVGIAAVSFAAGGVSPVRDPVRRRCRRGLACVAGDAEPEPSAPLCAPGACGAEVRRCARGRRGRIVRPCACCHIGGAPSTGCPAPTAVGDYEAGRPRLAACSDLVRARIAALARRSFAWA
jgi:hypothetical protein